MKDRAKVFQSKIVPEFLRREVDVGKTKLSPAADMVRQVEQVPEIRAALDAGGPLSAAIMKRARLEFSSRLARGTRSCAKADEVPIIVPALAVGEVAELEIDLSIYSAERNEDGTTALRRLRRRTKRPNVERGVQFVERAANSKLSPVERVVAPDGSMRLVNNPPHVAETRVSTGVTCPRSCLYYDGGCHAREGSVRYISQALDASAVGMTALDVAQQEAKEIEGYVARQDGRVPDDGTGNPTALRLHDLGDAGDEEGARILGKVIATAWQGSGGGACWTYTHGYEDIPREAWGPISVLASVETNAQEATASARGYVTARTCTEFPDGGNVFRFHGSSVEYIPCPYDVNEKTCVECRLCWDDGKLRSKNRGIAFAHHGHIGTRRAAKAALARAGAEKPISIRRSRTGPTLVSPIPAP